MKDAPLYRSGWSYVGEGLMWLLIWLGFGGCVALTTGKVSINTPDVVLSDNTVISVPAHK